MDHQTTRTIHASAQRVSVLGLTLYGALTSNYQDRNMARLAYLVYQDAHESEIAMGHSLGMINDPKVSEDLLNRCMAILAHSSTVGHRAVAAEILGEQISHGQTGLGEGLMGGLLRDSNPEVRESAWGALRD